jgi:hypothetical protein
MKRGGRELAGDAVGACITPVAAGRLCGIHSWLAGVFFHLFFALNSQPAGRMHKQLTSEMLRRRVAPRGIPFLIRY